jgi:hypothetical protein
VPQGVEVQVLSSAPLFIRGWAKKVALLTTTLLGNRLMLKTTEGHRTRHKTYSKKLKSMLRRTGTKIKKRGLINRVNIAVFVVLFAGIGGYFVINSFAATPTGTANLWIDGNASGTCQYSSSLVAYSPVTACETMQKAVAASSNTTTTQVRMIAGSYPGQTITTNKTQATKVTITAEPGTNLTGQLSTRGDWLTVENVSSKGADIQDVGGGHPINVTWNNVDVSGGLFYLDGGTNFTWKGGAFHDNNTNNEGHMVIQGIPPNCPENQTTPCSSDLVGAVIDGVRFYNLKRLSTCASVSCHNEVIRIDNGVHDLTIKNSKFESSNDPNSAVIFTGDKSYGKDEYNLTFEQNFFGSSGAASYALDVSRCDGLKILYNTFGGSDTNLTACQSGAILIKGNTGYHIAGCQDGAATATWDHNVWSDAACGGTDVGGKTMAFANSGASDFHLTSGSSDIVDVAGLTGCASTDIDGDPRPFGGGCDAGADEYGSVAGGGTPVLWVDADGGNCSRSVNYATGTACTWPAAYNAATTDETINVKGGNYSTVSMGPNNGRKMTFKAVSGESIVISGFEWRDSGHGPDNVTVIGPMKAGPSSIDGVTNTTFDNIDFDGGGGTSRAVQGTLPSSVPSSGANLTIKNSQLHNTVEANSMTWFTGASIVFDHNDFYDALINSGSKTHTECIYLVSTKNITISRSHFWDCDAEDVFVTDCLTCANNPWPNAVIENNVFEIVAGSDANAAAGLAFRNGGSPSPYPTNMLLRYNTFMSGVQWPDDTSGATGQVYGNYFRLSPPTGWGSIVYGCNVTSSGPSSGCSNTNASDFSASLINAGFTNPITTQGNGTPSNKAPKGDYSLKSSSPFIDLVNDSTNYPTTDFLGLLRYKGAKPDLGAYEYQSGTTPTCTKQSDINCDNNVNVTDLSILLSNYGKTTAQLASSSPSYPRADINNSGKVDIGDLSTLLTGYGK